MRRRIEEQRKRYMRIGWVVMKAFWKKQAKEKR